MLGLDVAGEGPRLGGVLRVGARQTDEECQSGRQAVGVLGKGRTSLHLVTVSWSPLHSAPCLSGREDIGSKFLRSRRFFPIPLSRRERGMEGAERRRSRCFPTGRGPRFGSTGRSRRAGAGCRRPGDLGQRGEGVFVVDHGLADPDGDVFVAGVGRRRSQATRRCPRGEPVQRTAGWR